MLADGLVACARKRASERSKGRSIRGTERTARVVAVVLAVRATARRRGCRLDRLVDIAIVLLRRGALDGVLGLRRLDGRRREHSLFEALHKKAESAKLLRTDPEERTHRLGRRLLLVLLVAGRAETCVGECQDGSSAT